MINFKENLKSSFKFILMLGFIFFACILVRLPHFLSKDFFFDGDEAMIGIMAQDFLEGKGLPIYFYGQNYGFSTIEVLSVSFFIKLFGSGIWALKLGALLIFSVGLTFIYLTLRNFKLSRLLLFTMMIIFICYPTWFLWAAMPRGGYVTSFMIVSILFYITQLKEFNWKWVIVSALLTAIGYEAQLLILIPVLPFLIVWISSYKFDYKKILGFIFLIFTTVFVIKYFGNNIVVWNAPEAVLFDIKQIENLLVQSEGFLFGYSNFCFFTMNIPMPVWWNVLLWISLLLILIYFVLFWKETDRKNRVLMLIGLFSLVFSVGLISTVSLYSPRYWLGFFTGVLFLLIYAVLKGKATKIKNITVLSIAAIFGLGLIAAKEMKRDWYQVNVNEMNAITSLYSEAKKRKIEAVFVADPVIQWKWNYLFGQEIPGTFFSKQERTNEFKEKVFHKYSSIPNKTAIIGLHKFYNGLDQFETFNQNCDQIATKYYIMDNVEKQFVEISLKNYN